MASIKRSELEKLKYDAKGWMERWLSAAAVALRLDADLEAWKVRTWQAEQEIHDLKVVHENKVTALEHAVKVYRDECDELIDEYVDECSAHDKLQDQYTELLAQQTVHQVNKPEQLKPLEVPKWDPGTFYSTPAPDLKSPEFIQSQIKRVNPVKKHFGRIAVALLLLAVIGLGAVTVRQNQIIQYQREVLREAAQYILQECPPVRNNSLDRAHQ